MKKSAVLPHPFRRLRWRLTFSYTLVTVAALVVVELALLSLLLILLNSEFLSEEFVKTIRDGYVPQASKYLESEPPDIDGLDTWLQAQVNDSVATNEGGRRITQGFSINFDQDFQIIVVDEDGNLLADYLWHWTGPDSGSASGVTLSVQLAVGDYYNVSLTVTDSGGATNTASATVSVRATAPP